MGADVLLVDPRPRVGGDSVVRAMSRSVHARTPGSIARARWRRPAVVSASRVRTLPRWSHAGAGAGVARAGRRGSSRASAGTYRTNRGKAEQRARAIHVEH